MYLDLFIYNNLTGRYKCWLLINIKNCVALIKEKLYKFILVVRKTSRDVALGYYAGDIIYSA